MHFKDNIFEKLHPYANVLSAIVLQIGNLIFEKVIGPLKVLKINSIKNVRLNGISLTSVMWVIIVISLTTNEVMTHRSCKI